MSTAILYARVSTRGQAERGYSLRQQIEALRQYAQSEGYEVLEEVLDEGHSGAALQRPGLERVRQLVDAGGVDVVLAQDRDRFAREPAYIYLLQSDFKRRGCKLRALNDRGDDSPEGDLHDGIMDQLAKFERAKLAERTSRGTRRKAREGKVIRSGIPHYGFEYNEAGDGYLVREDQMAVVGRIFEMVGRERMSLYSVKRTLEGEGTPTPRGGWRWSTKTIKDIVVDDVYVPFSHEEVAALVSPGVAERLDPAERYGILWWGRREVTVEDGPNNTRKKKVKERPRDQWIPIPVPSSGVSRELIDSARDALKNNRASSSKGGRLWELSGGVMVCGGCGWRMVTTNRRPKRDSERVYYYYRCGQRQRLGARACSQTKTYRAERTEAAVWEFVVGLLTQPEEIVAGLDRLIAKETEKIGGDPSREEAHWLGRMADIDRRMDRLQDEALDALMEDGLVQRDQLKRKLGELREQRETAERELYAARSRGERIRGLEEMKAYFTGDSEITKMLRSCPELEGAPLDEWEAQAREDFRRGMAEWALGKTTPEERHAEYRRLRLRVTTQPDGDVEVSGVFGEGIRLASKIPPPGLRAVRAVEPSAGECSVSTKTVARPVPD